MPLTEICLVADMPALGNITTTLVNNLTTTAADMTNTTILSTMLMPSTTTAQVSLPAPPFIYERKDVRGSTGQPVIKPPYSDLYNKRKDLRGERSDSLFILDEPL